MEDDLKGRDEKLFFVGNYNSSRVCPVMKYFYQVFFIRCFCPVFWGEFKKSLEGRIGDNVG